MTRTLDVSSLSSSEISLREHILLCGHVFTARDAAFRRMKEHQEKGLPLPIDLSSSFIYFCGPSPAPKGRIIGSCGPTTSDRMEPYLEMLFSHFHIGGCIGKGGFSEAGDAVFKKHSKRYFSVVGGIGALLSDKVKSASIVAFEDLGPEAIYRLEVSDFPVLFALNEHGDSIFNTAGRE